MARIEGGVKLRTHLSRRVNGKDLTPTLVKAADRLRTEYIDRVNEGGGTGKAHVPSKPGEAPNTDTGRLVGSAVASAIGRNAAQMSVEAEYAVFLELGTDRMAPRPALIPAFDYLRPYVLQNIERALKDG